MTEPRREQLKPNMFGCALLMLEDGCPPEKHMQLCSMQEDDDGSACKECWLNYLYYVVNDRKWDPYRIARIYEGGLHA